MTTTGVYLQRVRALTSKIYLEPHFFRGPSNNYFATHLFGGIIFIIRKSLIGGTADSIKLFKWDYVDTSWGDSQIYIPFTFWEVFLENAHEYASLFFLDYFEVIYDTKIDFSNLKIFLPWPSLCFAIPTWDLTICNISMKKSQNMHEKAPQSSSISLFFVPTWYS